MISLDRNIVFIFIMLFAAMSTSTAEAKQDKSRRVPAGNAKAFTDENKYDIKYLAFHLDLTDTSTFIRGTVITMAFAKANLDDYVFELSPSLHIDSAFINESRMQVTGNGVVRKIKLSRPVPAGSCVSVRICYHGAPPSGSGFFNGLTHSVSDGGTHMVYSLSDPYAASDWWPAKQDINDKIDSVDMFVTVPAGISDGSNGRLVNIDSLTDKKHWTWHWQTHYPIDYYLISVAVARYARSDSWMRFSGSKDSMLIQSFFLDTAVFNPHYKANFDSLGLMIDYFSSLYGRYPFWKEKYGVCYTTLPGGMEHQTMTTIGSPDTRTIAHELGHQWFGDHVTYATWGDVWLSEGFATFSEFMFFDHFWGPAAGLKARKYYLDVALSQPCSEVYVTDTSGPNTIFYQPAVYAKAAMVVNMLRYLAPADSLFFKVLQEYQQTYGFSNAGTKEFKSIAEKLYCRNLDTFFTRWIYGKGYPQYTIQWNQVDSLVYVKIRQSTSCATPLFSTPLELKLQSLVGDTVIQVNNNAAETFYTFIWPHPVTDLYVNRDAWTLCKINSLTRDPALGRKK